TLRAARQPAGRHPLRRREHDPVLDHLGRLGLSERPLHRRSRPPQRAVGLHEEAADVTVVFLVLRWVAVAGFGFAILELLARAWIRGRGEYAVWRPGQRVHMHTD